MLSTATAQPVTTDLTWGIYTQPNGDAVLDWALPTQAANQVIIRGAGIQPGRVGPGQQ